MAIKRKIKIFLASSIVEFEHERNELEVFIRNVSDIFEDKYDTKILPLRCENIDDRVRLEGTQSKLNEMIMESEMCFFIFFTKAGEYTRKEFKIAYDHLKATDGKNPKIYVYFKNVPSNVTVEQSVKDFMREIDGTFHHYYGTFDSVDTIKLRILLNLKMQEMDFVEVQIENNKCIVDGDEILSLDNVSEFANNYDLKQLTAELSGVDKKFYEMRPIYESGNIDDAFRKEYAAIAAKRRNLTDLIRELQSNIFDLSLGMSRDEVHGEVTARQREAYRLLEAGDSVGCLAVMSCKDIDDDYLRLKECRKLQREAEDKRAASVYIREHKLAIDVLQTMNSYKERFSEIEARYESIVREAVDYEVCLYVVYDYAMYLYLQKDFCRALTVADMLENCYSSDNTVIATDLIKLLNLQGMIYSKISEYYKAESKYGEAVILAEKDSCPGRELALSYNNSGALAGHLQRYDDAESYYLKACEIWERLALESPAYERDLAKCYHDIGALYSFIQRYDEAEKYYFKAIEIRENLVLINSYEYTVDLADSYFAFAAMYAYVGRVEEAEEKHLKAIELRQRLVMENPQAYEPDLATGYFTLGAMYAFNGRYEEAEEVHLKALSIRVRLAEYNPAAFSHDLAKSYTCIGDLYLHWRKYGNSEENYNKAYCIISEMAKRNPSVYERDLVAVCNGIGILYGRMNRKIDSEQFFEKALKIDCKLVEVSREAFVSLLVTTYYYYGEMCLYFGDKRKGMELWSKAVCAAAPYKDVEPVCADYYSKIIAKFPDIKQFE